MLVLHLSNELSDLSQWHCHDDCIVNIVVASSIKFVMLCYSAGCTD